ncbi:AIG2-like family-domain-containing protein [Staphylotrichum tortipilum]|uniref:Putative gamma-glutamylcyclotransferase n=1 Tax=Staphylotrichum tortipilum TaxID=2831512 RepID=A0AAN6MGZ2_9PEZI|nr:AIG2-like family-domain-containing protein [Staphylotrichum longicolle]
MTAHSKVESDEGTHCAFFYGTLMVPDVFYSVCYNSKDVPDAIAKLHSFRPALLHGYCRRRVKYADYPGITEDSAHDVFGTFTTGLTKANMAKLDFFEGSQYERRTVSVTLLEKLGNVKGEGQVEGQERKAEVYVYLDKRELEEKEWDLEEFRREKLQQWTRAGYVFEDCDPNAPATVASDS